MPPVTPPHRRRRRFVASLPPLAGLLALSAVAAAPPRAARAQTPSRIVVFGDSLSDNGNLYAASGNTVPVSPPYFQGRLSNGPVWIERVATALGVPLVDLAVAGARTDATNVSNSFPGVPANTFPGMATQVGGFVAANPVLDPTALYVLWGGANDYLNGGQTNPIVPVSNLGNQMTQLAGAGARRFLVVNLPDLGQTPGTRGTAFSTGLDLLTAGHNAGLQSAVTNFSAANPSASVTLLDVNTLFRQAIANPGAFGFINATDNYVSSQGQPQGVAPLSVGMGDPNSYLFWDEIHPTAAAHQMIANRAISAVSAPEPGSAALAGLPLVVAGVGAIRRRRRAAKVAA